MQKRTHFNSSRCRHVLAGMALIAIQCISVFAEAPTSKEFIRQVSARDKKFDDINIRFKTTEVRFIERTHSRIAQTFSEEELKKNWARIKKQQELKRQMIEEAIRSGDNRRHPDKPRSKYHISMTLRGKEVTYRSKQDPSMFQAGEIGTIWGEEKGEIHITNTSGQFRNFLNSSSSPTLYTNLTLASVQPRIDMMRFCAGYGLGKYITEITEIEQLDDESINVKGTLSTDWMKDAEFVAVYSKEKILRKLDASLKVAPKRMLVLAVQTTGEKKWTGYPATAKSFALQYYRSPTGSIKDADTKWQDDIKGEVKACKKLSMEEYKTEVTQELPGNVIYVPHK